MKARNLLITISILISVFTVSNLLTAKLSAAVISPDKYYINIQDNNSVNQKLIIYSTPNQEKKITYRIRPIGIIKIGENNERTFYTPDSAILQDAANWIQVLDAEVSVEPGQTAEVRWNLNVPDNYTCETKLAGLAISEVNTDIANNGNNISINNEVISQIHINTSKNDTENCKYYESLVLQEFKTTQSIPIFNYDNIEFSTLLENRSDYLAKNLKGFIEIFGLGEKEVVEFNDSNLDVYPHSLRRFESTWIDKDYPRGNFIQEIIYEFTHFKFGMYTVRLGITKNIQTPIVSTINIFIFPIRPILIILVVLILLFFFFRNNYKIKKELNSIKNKTLLPVRIKTKKVKKTSKS